jgi:tRNA (mo5U34)-methyltransferase
MDLEGARRRVRTIDYWHHRFEIFPGLVTPGAYDPKPLLDLARLPADLSGRRVLDVGTSDGYFALQLARRGAEVTAIDYRDKTGHGFAVMEALNPDVRIAYRKANLFDLPALELGEFDIVWFMGVLYHLPDMIRGLHVVRQACRGELYLETRCENDFAKKVSAARYYRRDSLGGDLSNFWAPNRLCVLDMLADTGFSVERDAAWNRDRLFVKAHANPADEAARRKMKYGYELFD